MTNTTLLMHRSQIKGVVTWGTQLHSYTDLELKGQSHDQHNFTYSSTQVSN